MSVCDPLKSGASSSLDTCTVVIGPLHYSDEAGANPINTGVASGGHSQFRRALFGVNADLNSGPPPGALLVDRAQAA